MMTWCSIAQEETNLQGFDTCTVYHLLSVHIHVYLHASGIYMYIFPEGAGSDSS